MDEIAKKVSAYNLMNALIPGGALVYSLEAFGYLNLKEINVLCLVPMAFILGLIGSRIGSLILESIAIKLKLIERDYERYTQAQATDDRLFTLTTVSNMYRTLAGSTLVLAILALGKLFPESFRPWIVAGLGVAVFLLFILSWIKQERYVSQRVHLYGKDGHVNH